MVATTLVIGVEEGKVGARKVGNLVGEGDGRVGLQVGTPVG